MNVSEVTWLDALGVLMSVFEMMESMGMNSDAAALAALMVFFGGLAFWFMVSVGVVVGLYRLTRRAAVSIMDAAGNWLSMRRARTAK